MPKKQDKLHLMQVVRDTDKMSVILNVVERATEKVIRTLTFLWADVHKDARKFVMLYGLLSILRDRNSQVPLVQDKLDAFLDTFNETLKIGIIKRDRVSSGKRLTDFQTEVLAKYFARKAGKPVSLKDVRDGWHDLSEDQKDTILTRKEVVAMMVAMAKKQATPVAVSFDEFLEDD